jgi:hypothetical protein
VSRDKSTKPGGGKLNRTQTVTIRLDPRMRYLTELAARSQRRTTSGFIEWAIEEALNRIEIDCNPNLQDKITLKEAAQYLWDTDESDRFIKLTQNSPNLLTHDEQVLYKLIMENGFIWEFKEGQLQTSDKNKLRKYWNDLKSVADESMELTELLQKIKENENG